jgi:hypothetical protein
MPERQMSPEEQAKAAYNQGIRAVKAADKLSKSAEEATDEKKTKAQDKAKRQYENARGYFRFGAAAQAGHVRGVELRRLHQPQARRLRQGAARV